MPSSKQGGFLRDDATWGLVVSGLTAQAKTWTGEGTTTSVDTEAGLIAAIAAASAGDTIELADGTYDLTDQVVVGTDGIRIKAATPLGAVVRGSATAPTAADVETTPPHIVWGFRVHGDNVFIEDIHFKWLGVAVELDSVDDCVVQGCRFESQFDVGVTAWDCIRPQIHMNEFLDPYLAGDTPSTLTTATLTGAQSDYGVNCYGCQDPRVTHNYFHGVFNQALSFKEGNANPYAGFNTFEGANLTALFLGQNGANNGPWTHTGLPDAYDSGDAVIESNVFRPIQSNSQTYRMNIAIRCWHFDGDSVTIRNNVVEAAVRGIQLERQDTGDLGTFKATTVTIENNTCGGSWETAAGVMTDVGNYGILIYKGIDAAPVLLNNACVYQQDQDVEKCGDAGQGGVCPVVTETGTVSIALAGTEDLPLATASSTFDPDLSFASVAT